jgi:hypothetical protein
MKKLTGFILAMMLMATTTISTLAVEYGAEIKNAPTKVYTQKFSDVPTDHWAFQYIGEMIERKVFAGYPDGKFRPSNTITRAEFAKIMIAAANITMDINDDIMYSDVGSDHWARSFVNNAALYMTGYNVQGRLEFRPESPALREDIAVALVKLKGYDTSSADLSLLKSMFADYESISHSARKYVATAVERGLISGYEDETFRAQQSITRAEACVLLWRAYQYGNDNKVVSETAPDVLPSATPSQTSKPIAVTTPAPVVEVTAPTPTATTTPTPDPTPETGSWSSHTLVSYKGNFSPIHDMQYIDKFVYVASGIGIDAISLEGAPFELIKYSDIKLNDKPINVVKSVIGVNYNSDAAPRVLFGLSTANEFMLYYFVAANDVVQLAYYTEIKGEEIDKILFLKDNSIILVTKKGYDSTVYKVDMSDGTLMKLFTANGTQIDRIYNNNFLAYDSRNVKVLDISGETVSTGSYLEYNHVRADARVDISDTYFSYREYVENANNRLDYTEVINEDSLPIKFNNMKFPIISTTDKVLIFWDSAYNKIRMIKQN